MSILSRKPHQTVQFKGSDVRIDTLKSIRWNYFAQKPLKLLMKSTSTIIFGIIFTFLGSVLICWNESEAIYVTKLLDESYNLLTKLPSANIVNSMYNNKLIHITGTLSIATPVFDDLHNIKVKAIRLKRRVQMFQWVEEKYTLSDQMYGSMANDSNTYVDIWKDKLVDSSLFEFPVGHENPRSYPIHSQVWTATVANIGAYNISLAIKETFNKFVPFSGDEEPENENLKLHSGMYYQTKDIFSPEIGDIRLQFYFAGHDGELVTIIAKQEGRTLYPFVTSDGRELLVIKPGRLSPEQMLSFGHSRSHIFTWFNRISGCFLLFIGSNLLSSLFQYFAYISPTINEVAVAGIGSVCFTVSLCLSLTLVGFAWVFYRPVMALLILLVAWSPMLSIILNKLSR